MFIIGTYIMLLRVEVNDNSAKSLTAFVPVAIEASDLYAATYYYKTGLDCMLY